VKWPRWRSTLCRLCYIRTDVLSAHAFKWRLPTASALGVALTEIGKYGRRDGRVLREHLGAMTYECILRCTRLSSFHRSAAQALIARTLDTCAGTRSCRSEQSEPTGPTRKKVPQLPAPNFYVLEMYFMERCSSAPQNDPDPPMRSRARTALASRSVAFARSIRLASRMPLPACPRLRCARV